MVARGSTSSRFCLSLPGNDLVVTNAPREDLSVGTVYTTADQAFHELERQLAAWVKAESELEEPRRSSRHPGRYANIAEERVSGNPPPPAKVSPSAAPAAPAPWAMGSATPTLPDSPAARLHEDLDAYLDLPTPHRSV